MVRLTHGKAFVNTLLYGDDYMTRRLTVGDWLEAGMQALARDGFHALKAEPLAKALGVSRGSFYWHFADVTMFHQALIQHWRQLATEAIIAEVEHIECGPERLRTLLRRALSAEATFEIRMRSWAAVDASAAVAVAHVDRARQTFISRLLVEGGVAPDIAGIRAAILYWAYLGCTLADQKPDGSLLDQVVEELHTLGLGGPEDALTSEVGHQ
jgi:AcrR family transcriptional regulator